MAEIEKVSQKVSDTNKDNILDAKDTPEDDLISLLPDVENSDELEARSSDSGDKKRKKQEKEKEEEEKIMRGAEKLF